MSQEDSNHKKNQIPMWARSGHARPVTRRDFLSAGIIPFTAGLIVPQWLNMLTANSAEAAEEAIPVCNTTSAGLPALMVVNLTGGAAMGANFVPMRADGSMLKSYSKMGLGAAPEITREFNNVAFYAQSGILAGIRANAAEATRQKTAFTGLCVKSRDDSRDNPFAIEGMAHRAGLVGSILPQLSRGGAYHKFAIATPPAPLAVSKVADITGSLGYAGNLRDALKPKQKEQLAHLIKNLSTFQARRLMASSGGAQIKTLVECAGIKNADLNSGVPSGVSLNETTDIATRIRTIWNIQANQNNQDSIFANMAYNVLSGNAGAGTISLGGYDYHDNTRTTGDARDRTAGDVIGRILETAAALGKPVFIYVTSDGSVVSPTSDTAGGPWSSDRGDAGCNYMLAFHPSARPTATATQVGSFTDAQAADGLHPIGNNPEAAAAAAFANYLSFGGKVGLFQGVASGSLTEAQLNEVIKIQG